MTGESQPPEPLSKTPCPDCEMLAKEFSANPGGKPMLNKGLALVAVTGTTYERVPIFLSFFLSFRQLVIDLVAVVY